MFLELLSMRGNIVSIMRIKYSSSFVFIIFIKVQLCIRIYLDTSRCGRERLPPNSSVVKKLLPSSLSFSFLVYPHAPQQRLVGCHSDRLPEVPRSNWLVGVGGAHQFSKLQDLIIWTVRGKKNENVHLKNTFSGFHFIINFTGGKAHSENNTSAFSSI